MHRAPRQHANDLVQEALLRVHLRLLDPAADPVQDLVSFSVKVLDGLIIDAARRSNRLAAALALLMGDPNAAPADRRTSPADAQALIALMPSLQRRFRGHVQRAILVALATGETFLALADRLHTRIDEVRRTARRMERTLWADHGQAVPQPNNNQDEDEA